MEGVRRYLALLTLLQLYQGLLGQLQVSPKYTVVNPGEQASFLCKYQGAIDSCQFTVGGISLFLKPGRGKDGISYYGAGLDQGECGIMIKQTQERHNGNISCSVAPDSVDPTGQTAYMRLVIALAPQKPELDVSVGTENNGNTYRERDVLSASCVVRDGRPAANISWYMGDELIQEGLRIPVETCTPQKKELCTIQQNLTRTLQATDDKKILKCVASHHALKGRDLVAEYKINVNYPPKTTSTPLERFGLVEGVTGRVPVMIEANPKPIISWTIGGEHIYEGTNNGRYNVEATVQKGPGQYETTLVIDTLTREDTDKEYKVTAVNDLGEAHYTVTISTSPEPRVLEMGAGLIIIIVGAILVILLILGGVFYARAKGKLCFAGSESPRIAGESSDTESADHHPERRPKLSFVSVFKKKGDKVAADKEMLKNITVDDEKPESVEQRVEKPKEKEAGESVVYAELDLGGHAAARPGPAVVVRVDDDKTEYAEIIHTQPPASPAPAPAPASTSTTAPATAPATK